MEAITVCQSKYKIIIVINNGTKSKVTSITIMTGKGTETRRKKENKIIKVRHAPAKVRLADRSDLNGV